MTTPDEISAAFDRLESRWDEQGGCRTCGFHAQLAEHDVDETDILWAMNHCDGQLRLSCQAIGDNEAWPHPGPVVYIGE